ncbi:MAG: BamA/TamA family outer membrane protein [Thiobacillus sp.]|nr:BamA/TamA family outer membrane protein [Thiobacillus sp.]
MIRRTLFWAALCALSPQPGAFADTLPDAGAIQRLERDQIDRLMQERRLDQQPAQPDITLPGQPAPSEASRVRNIPVKRFQVNASAILSPAELQAVLSPYEDKTLSLADLFEAVAAINGLYDDKHMPTARAFLPPQEIRDGIVTLRLVEARVGEIQIGEMQQISQSFVRERTNLARGDLMSVPALEADLLRFNRLHDVQLRASVQPGTQPGTTDLRLLPVEPQRNQFSVFADNAGRYTVGETRIGFTARRAGLTGQGDTLLFAATFSKGSDSYYLGYSLPLTPDDLKLDLSYSKGGIEVVKGAFVPLDVSGRSSDLSVGLSWPLRVTASELWTLYGRLSSRESISEFGGATQQDTDLTALTAGVSGEQLGDTRAWTVDASLSQGVKSLGGESRYTVVRVNLALQMRFSTRLQLLLRGNGQYSGNDLLPSQEQFQLGGSASVRGYSEGLLSGRSGYLTSVELRYRLDGLNKDVLRDARNPQLTALLFLDHGGAFPYRPAPLKRITQDDFLTGAGVGLLANWNPHISARLAIAWPLKENQGETREREPRMHAALAYSW